ncbi:5'/3'-nucleotidase SurE [Helicobacter monodelphidis]|uniref:5'/3'-nucleotidase SurE n=1 Tax=Helicobacter sp. 15-1451 TaxID=2004995 RepID=UPI000DCDE291|nr:5'/3'-nucleotidase SurE [Helicobacter sp. 15-1451]RAX59235.1 5'/3'-nucleotidase SurE [Helicobacter sp. 15-1451]
MKRILITNDDGFESPALLALKEALTPLGEILIVAPSSEKSACGHSLTLKSPLHFIKVDDDFYKLHDGTPTDCVYLALHALYECSKKPDVVVSGINLGSNMGEDTTYSGTVGGAMEGCIAGIPSIALSQMLQDKNGYYHGDFALAKKVAYELVERILTKGFPLDGRHLLNVNIPDCSIAEFKGYKVCELGYRLYGNDAHLHRNPRGEEYYWLGLHPLEWEEREGNNSDFKALFSQYAAITPLKLNLTSYGHMERVERWL